MAVVSQMSVHNFHDMLVYKFNYPYYFGVYIAPRILSSCSSCS